MLNLIFKLMALRPLLSMAIFGIPILTLVAIGLFAIIALKIVAGVLLIVVPLVLVVWLIRRYRRQNSGLA